ncbi:GntR family transcriptional regulator [Mycolicibacterium murale]|uniref:GntR family transcriptional regulator n=1 Tax=Mycolicibacterium murale TaxID=182220 RepID=A0A7I9WUS7_9MYCO|nr:GntR family transcriptional regulator [Mycolicibacterium murale]MCV7181610.1 GntR family transcriptional regulator [Mycolicibacterium murale]GFG60937.1 GntR family transcriptional regulator [Mycolicibacterium murale]
MTSATDRPAADHIVSSLQHRILTGEIEVGSWLRHSALAEEYGTSRTPVREALLVLASRGIVTIERNRGAQVNGLSARDIRELGDVRATLEGLAAELAADRITDIQTEALLASLEDYEKTAARIAARSPKARSSGRSGGDAGRWAESNESFHRIILEAAGNRNLTETLELIHSKLPNNTAYVAYVNSSRLLERNVKEHRKIGRAIADHDGDAARRAMTEHVRNSIEAVVRWAEDRHQVRN